uniref:Galectin domain-containing protein n=1 Tax=Meloidogyne incognita TaxID=6306 RepID=A0A914LUM8_MELIC
MQQTADVPFHFKPLFRSNPTLVVRNNWIRNGGWGPQETFGGFPFKTNQPFILEFVAAEKNTIIININNQRFATFSRVDLSRISQLYVIGMNTIRVNTLTLCPNPVITTTTLRPTTTTEEPTTTTELTTTEEPTTTTTEEQTTTPLPTCPYPIVIPYPKIPATIDLLKLGFGEGFAPPKRIRFVGSPTNTTDRFTINLYSDGVPDKTATTLFHFNPRFNDKQVIRNTWSPITGWEEEEHYGGFPFKIGEPFVLEFIAAPENTIIVNVDSQPLVNFSRDDLSKLSTLGVSSAIELSSVVLCHDKPITSTIEPTTTTEEQATTTEEPTTIEEPTTTTEEPTTTTEEPTTTTSKPTTTILPTTTTTKPPQYCPGQIVLNNLKIPATLDFVKLGFGTGFHFFVPKKRIIIFGTPLAQPTAFNINIGEPAQPTAFNINIGEPGKLLVTANVLFHLSPDFLKNKVIRNTWIVGKGWGKEENHGGFPFKVEEPFVLELYEGADYFDIKVNNKPFVSFERYNMDKVSQMEIENGIQVSSVILCPSLKPTTTTKSPTTTTGKPSTTLLPTTTPSKPPPFVAKGDN